MLLEQQKFIFIYRLYERQGANISSHKVKYINCIKIYKIKFVIRITL